MKNESDRLAGRLESYENSCGEQPATGKSLPDLKILTSAAAGLGLLLACPHAEAAIQWSGAQNIHLSVTSNSYFLLDMDGGGVDDLVLYATSSIPGLTNYRSVLINNLASSAEWMATVTATSSNYFLPARLSNGSNVDVVAPWNSSSGYLAWRSSSSTGGNFLGARGFIGVRFQLGGETKYGWIDFEGDAQDAGQGTIYGWAYEDVTDDSIIAGDTGAAIPTLNEWGMIILVGLLAAGGLVYGRKEEELG